MTEAEWLTNSTARNMIGYLRANLQIARYKIGRRQLRLLACGACRLVWDLLTDERSRKAVEGSELYADKLITEEALVLLAKGALAACQEAEWRSPKDCHGMVTRAVTRAAFGVTRNPTPVGAIPQWQAEKVLHEAMKAPAFLLTQKEFNSIAEVRIGDEEYKAQMQLIDEAEQRLIREIFGNPFRPVHIDANWLRWNDGTVPKLVRTIYDERRFDAMPILADALEEAGCVDNQILNHCREPGPHVRGCFVVDALLSKS